MRYLNGTKEFGILFKKCSSTEFRLSGFTDSDFASCFTRKSRTGYIFFVGGCIVSWSSKKKNVIALSTCEAEFYALTEGGKESIHLNRLMWEFVNQSPISDSSSLQAVDLFCDNQSTIFVSKNPAEFKTMKHIDLRQKWIQEKVENGDFKVHYVSTKNQLADILTKPLPKELFEKLREECGIVRQPFRLAREC